MRRVVLALVITGWLASGCAIANGAQVPGPATNTGQRAQALAALGAPRPEDTGAHYNRKDWGEWAYDPATKCNTREQVLARDGVGIKLDDQCKAKCPAGTCWTSRYDGKAVKDAADLQIDHLVPLAEANRSGARDWSPERRNQFYNDPANLVPVTAKSNGSKGDSDPGRWRPQDRAAWCDYATGYVAIKAKYGLSVDDQEYAELERMLNSCP